MMFARIATLVAAGAAVFTFAACQPGVIEPTETPRVTVTPFLGLADGQTVQVTATGITHGPSVAAEQCIFGPATAENVARWCDWATRVERAAPGPYAFDFTVRRNIAVGVPAAPVDCTEYECQIVVYSTDADPDTAFDGANQRLNFAG
jgi:hypothetical protein